jgi:hypothetical protein
MAPLCAVSTVKSWPCHFSLTYGDHELSDVSGSLQHRATFPFLGRHQQAGRVKPGPTFLASLAASRGITYPQAERALLGEAVLWMPQGAAAPVQGGGHTCVPSTWESEAGGWRVLGQPGLQSKDPVSKNKMRRLMERLKW